jgi:hypothetical protein
MAVVDKFDRLYSARATGKFGDCAQGVGKPETGIYQRRHRGKKIIIVKEKIYSPTNNHLENQEIWRGVFAAGVEAWQGLTQDEKNQYNKKAESRHIEGFNLFMKRWLINHKT